MKNIFFTLILLFAFSEVASAKILLTYNKLALRDLDEMNDWIRMKIKESKKQPPEGAVVVLKETLLAIYSRPNEDGMIDKVSSAVKNELERMDAYEISVEELISEAIDGLKISDGLSATEQVTYLVFLENQILEMKPALKKGEFEKKMFEKIANAQIQVTKKAQGERKLRMMRTTVGPSEMAKKIQFDLEVSEKEELKKEKEAKTKDVDSHN